MAAERIIRYKPQRKAVPMHKGTIVEFIAKALVRARGASIPELRDMLIAKFGKLAKFTPNYVSGYIYDLGKRGYGIAFDYHGRYYLTLPARARGLAYREDKGSRAAAAPRRRKAASPASRAAVKPTVKTRARKAAAKTEAEPRTAAKAAKRAARTASGRKAKAPRATAAKAAPRRAKATETVAAEKTRRVRRPKAKPETTFVDDEMNPTYQQPVAAHEYRPDEIDNRREFDETRQAY